MPIWISKQFLRLLQWSPRLKIFIDSNSFKSYLGLKLPLTVTKYLCCFPRQHQLCDDLVCWVRDSSSANAGLVCDTLVPLLSDMTCLGGHSQIKKALEKSTGGPSGSNAYNDTLNFYSVKVILCNQLIVNDCYDSCFMCKISCKCICYIYYSILLHIIL